MLKRQPRPKLAPAREGAAGVRRGAAWRGGERVQEGEMGVARRGAGGVGKGNRGEGEGARQGGGREGKGGGGRGRGRGAGSEPNTRPPAGAQGTEAVGRAKCQGHSGPEGSGGAPEVGEPDELRASAPRLGDH